MKTYSLIAHALESYLKTRIQTDIKRRKFFRLDGFDLETYMELLENLKKRDLMLGDHTLWVRTTGEIEGYEEFSLELGKSATWYRNNLPSECVLILIFNSQTSDVQSLKDIYPVSETLLATEGLDQLIDASVSSYQLSAEQRRILKGFIDQLNEKLFQPQLRDIADFLNSLNVYFQVHKAASIEEAISQCLPYLNLFRCTELVDVLNSSKAIRLLNHNFRAAGLGIELLNDSDQSKYLQRLEKADFDDDEREETGLTAAEKRENLRKFITGVITDRDQFLKVLQIDWYEIEPVLHKPPRRTKEELAKELAASLQEALEEQQIDIQALSESAQHAIDDLEVGAEPDDDSLDDLLVEVSENLPRNLQNRLKRLRTVRKYQSADFIAGVTHLAVEFLSSLENEEEQFQLAINFNRDQIERPGPEESEALLAFRTFYGGLDTIMGYDERIVWNLDDLWDLIEEYGEIRAESDQEQEGERTGKVDLVFSVTVLDQENNTLERADLTWIYRLNGPTAATVFHINAEALRLQRESLSQLPIPIYDNASFAEEIGDLDLGRPIFSLGAWYRESQSLRVRLEEELKLRSSGETWNRVEKAIDNLEIAWTGFIETASSHGLFYANFNALLLAYNEFLGIASNELQTGQEVNYGFRLLPQAWVIGPKSFGNWAVIPFLHPLKLHWWKERARQFTELIARLLDGESYIVDEKRLQRELSTTYSSNNYPALISLPGRDARPEYFLPVQEVEGYELYLPLGQANIAYGLDPTLVTEDESERAATEAARELSRVVRDYIETYPFVRDGLEIFLVECRNGALPGLLINELNRIARHRNWQIQLNIIVHTTDRGAPLFQRVEEWLRANGDSSERGEGYFPPITLKVLECPLQELYQSLEDNDLVILPDVLAERGQEVEAYNEGVHEDAPSLDGYLPIYRIRQAPFEREEITRDILLTTQPQPNLLQCFYNIQWAAKQRRPISPTDAMDFRLQVSLRDWEDPLRTLHQHFNWVVCYDTSVDRFLLEATFPDTVEIIRYSLGLGTNQRHNLTVSSASRTQTVVVRRLASNLKALLPYSDDSFRENVALRLVDEAKKISGDIVLRAAGPGVFLNELIGMVIAKYRTERRHGQNSDPLATWIYLDDFSHWFQGKFPDLLFVKAHNENENLSLQVEVIETKCVNEASFAAEAGDAQRQVAEGVNRLVKIWSPNAHHLDAPYWYDQLYRAIVGNLKIEGAHESIWKTLRQKLPQGDFSLKLSGHTWICCHDGSAGISGFVDEKSVDIDTPEAICVPRHHHHISRSGLRQYLRELVEDWGMEAPGEVWSEDDESQFVAVDLVTTSDADQKKLEEEVVDDQDTRDSIPDLELTTEVEAEHKDTDEWLESKANELTRVLRDFEIRVRPIEMDKIDIGPSIVRFKLRLYPGERINRLQNIATDLERELALRATPMVENVSGTKFVGIDIPRPEPMVVSQLPKLNELDQLEDSWLSFLAGVTPAGHVEIDDLADLFHLLVAGSTGSGKTIFLYSLIVSLLHQFDDNELKLLLVDPKQTDFIFFDRVPHLLSGQVIIEPEEAIGWLEHLTEDVLTTRTQQLRESRSRNLRDHNSRNPGAPIAPIVVIIDEYADLVQILDKNGREAFEHNMVRLAQRARNVGIHLVVATQRPSADIVTSRLKTNLPARMAFRLPSHQDSMIILDQTGAENLLGRGDLLFKRGNEVIRLQGFYLSAEELEQFLRQHGWLS